MSVRKITPTDTLGETFRSKFNETADEIITSVTDNGDGTITFNKFGEGEITLDLSGTIYTQEQVNQIFSAAEPKTGAFVVADFSGNNLTITHTQNTSTPTLILFDSTGVKISESNISYQATNATTIIVTCEMGAFNGTWKVSK